MEVLGEGEALWDRGRADQLHRDGKGRGKARDRAKDVNTISYPTRSLLKMLAVWLRRPVRESGEVGGVKSLRCVSSFLGTLESSEAGRRKAKTETLQGNVSPEDSGL